MWFLDNLELWLLPKLVVMSIIVAARFLLLGAGHFNSGNTTQPRSLTEPNNVGPRTNLSGWTQGQSVGVGKMHLQFDLFVGLLKHNVSQI